MNFIEILKNFILVNYQNIGLSLLSVILGIIMYKLLERELESLKRSNRIESHVAYTLKKIIQWFSFFVILYLVLSQFGLKIGSLVGFLTIFGSTVIGFAAINTVGNAIAGLIVMISRPFKIGDRIYFKGKYADIVSIELIYTKMKTLDNVLVSVPNQELLKTEIDNYGKKKIVRRRCTITAGFEHEFEEIEKVLLEATKKTGGILEMPRPFVRITKFQNFAVEYTLFAFTKDIKNLRQTDANLYQSVFKNCKANKIDISTPTLYKQV